MTVVIFMYAEIDHVNDKKRHNVWLSLSNTVDGSNKASLKVFYLTFSSKSTKTEETKN